MYIAYFLGQFYDFNMRKNSFFYTLRKISDIISINSLRIIIYHSWLYFDGICELICVYLFYLQAVKLESVHPGRTRYLVVVSCMGRQDAEESCLLGIDCHARATVGLVLRVLADTAITLDGDGLVYFIQLFLKIYLLIYSTYFIHNLFLFYFLLGD